MKIGIASFTPNGDELRKKICTLLNEQFLIYEKSENSIFCWSEKCFSQCDAIIFVGAIGIAVRSIAPFINSKSSDPAIVVLDELGKFSIPILSGHIGGANALALRIANLISATPVITTATDINGIFGVDVWSGEQNLHIFDTGKIKYVSSALLRGEEVGFYSDFPVDDKLPMGLVQKKEGLWGICVSLNRNLSPFRTTLNLAPKILTLGMGCKKNTDSVALRSFALETLEKNKLSIESVVSLASIDIKHNERALLDFAKEFSLEFTTYSGEQLQKVSGDFNSSQFVKNTVGVDNVCERSAVLHSKGKLIVPKHSKDGMTIAISATNWRCMF